MKKYIVKFAFVVALMIGFASCKKDVYPLFDTPGGVHFSDTLWTYSFIADPELKEKVIEIPTKIFGKTEGVARNYKVVVLTDDTLRVTTLPESNFELLESVVPADSILGRTSVKVTYLEEMDTKVFSVYFKIVPDDQFPNAEFRGRILRLDVTNKMIQPANWNGSLRYFFGMKYSDNWWRFILKATKRTDLPYWPGQDSKIWWMDDYELEANVALVRTELEKYNAQHPDDKLKHDDETEVSM